jgi:hypothetical protein
MLSQKACTQCFSECCRFFRLVLFACLWLFVYWTFKNKKTAAVVALFLMKCVPQVATAQGFGALAGGPLTPGPPPLALLKSGPLVNNGDNALGDAPLHLAAHRGWDHVVNVESRRYRTPAHGSFSRPLVLVFSVLLPSCCLCFLLAGALALFYLHPAPRP